MHWLEATTLGSASVCLIALGVMHRRTKAYGPRALFARAAGDPRAGVRYAFGKGLTPGAKESVREHPLTWGVGIGFHSGVFAAFACLLLLLLGIEPRHVALRALHVVAGLGALFGLALLVKRATVAHLRGISHADDFVANGLTSAFCLVTAVSAFRHGVGPWVLAVATVLFLYIPVGKIRHCLFFFPTRYHFGAFFGRRGVFPPASRKV